MSRSLAAVLPTAILALGLAGLRTYDRGPGPGAAFVNQAERPDAVGWISAHLREVRPDVVVIGNSLGEYDVDPELLGAALGVDPERIATLTVRGSVASHWAALVARIFAEGHRPRWVLLVGDLQSALAIRPRTPTGLAYLEALLADDLPELRERIDAGTGWPALDAIEVNRGRLRRDLVGTIRGAAVGLLGAPDTARSPVRWGSDQVGRSGARVFQERDLAFALTREIRTGFDERYQVTDPGDLLAPSASLLPTLRSLAEAHGARLVLVRPPLSPQNPSWTGDRVPPGTEAALTAELPAPHAYIDGAALHLGLAAYLDLMHLGQSGARKFTEILGERLRRVDDAPPTLGLDGSSGVTTPPPELAPRAGEPGIAGTSSWLLPQVGRVHEELWAVGITPPEDCVPVEVHAPAGALARIACGDLFTSERQGSCFDGERLFARPPAGLDPGALFLVASERRACGPFLWSYPGDVVRFEAGDSGPIRVGATGDAPPELELTAAGASVPLAPVAPWSRVDAPGTLVLEGVVPAGPFEVRNASSDRLVVLWRVGREP